MNLPKYSFALLLLMFFASCSSDRPLPFVKAYLGDFDFDSHVDSYNVNHQDTFYDYTYQGSIESFDADTVLVPTGQGQTITKAILLTDGTIQFFSETLGWYSVGRFVNDDSLHLQYMEQYGLGQWAQWTLNGHRLP